MPATPFTDPAGLMEMINSFRQSRVILTAYELGIFSAFDSHPKTSDEIATAVNADPRATDRLMNALAALGLLHKQGNLFSNSDFAAKFLVQQSPAYMSGLQHTVHLWKTWSSMTDCIKTGKSVAYPGPINDRADEWLEGFIAAMHYRAIPQARETADLLDLTGVKRILDIGGGSGAFCFEFVNRVPGASAVVFDLPNVVPITHKYISKSGLEENVSTLAGNYLTDCFGSGYDLVFISAVIHINSSEENMQLIKKSVDAMNPGGQLVISDWIMNDERTKPEAGALFALNMLVGTQKGDTYTESEVTNWMMESGLKNIQRKPMVNQSSLMVGVK